MGYWVLPSWLITAKSVSGITKKVRKLHSDQNDGQHHATATTTATATAFADEDTATSGVNVQNDLVATDFEQQL